MEKKKRTELQELCARKLQKLVCPCLVLEPEKKPDYETAQVMLCGQCRDRLTGSATGLVILHRGPYRLVYIRMPYRRLRSEWKPQSLTVTQLLEDRVPERPEEVGEVNKESGCGGCRGL